MKRNTAPHNPSPRGSNFLRMLVCCLLIAGPFSATAEPNRQETSRATGAIRALTEEMWDALGEQNRERFEKVCTSDWQLYTASGAEFSAGQLFEVHEAKIREFQLTASRVKIRVQGNLAWATYEALMEGKLAGEPWGGSFLMTHIYEKKEGNWLSAHTHESKLPEDD